MARQSLFGIGFVPQKHYMEKLPVVVPQEEEGRLQQGTRILKVCQGLCHVNCWVSNNLKNHIESWRTDIGLLARNVLLHELLITRV